MRKKSATTMDILAFLCSILILSQVTKNALESSRHQHDVEIKLLLKQVIEALEDHDAPLPNICQTPSHASNIALCGHQFPNIWARELTQPWISSPHHGSLTKWRTPGEAHASSERQTRYNHLSSWTNSPSPTYLSETHMETDGADERWWLKPYYEKSSNEAFSCLQETKEMINGVDSNIARDEFLVIGNAVGTSYNHLPETGYKPASQEEASNNWGQHQNTQAVPNRSNNPIPDTAPRTTPHATGRGDASGQREGSPRTASIALASPGAHVETPLIPWQPCASGDTPSALMGAKAQPSPNATTDDASLGRYRNSHALSTESEGSLLQQKAPSEHFEKSDQKHSKTTFDDVTKNDGMEPTSEEEQNNHNGNEHRLDSKLSSQLEGEKLLEKFNREYGFYNMHPEYFSRGVN